MQQAQVPKFGNWESEDDVPYTQYFDNARKNKKGDKMNPNDPQDFLNAEMKSEKGPEARMPKHVRCSSHEDGEMIISADSHLQPDATSQKSVTGSPHRRQGGSKYGSNRSDLDAPRDTDMQQSREEGDLRRSADSPLHNEPANRRTPHDSPHHQSAGMSAGETPKRVGRQNVGSDRIIERSPLHPHSQVRIGGRGSGVSSPSWERKGPLEGSQGMAPLTPGRSRLRSVTRGDETPDHGPAVPKFGDWDENDPTSAEGFSHIFNQVREEKQSGAGKVPSMPNETSYYSNGPKKIGSENSKSCWCFPWGRR